MSFILFSPPYANQPHVSLLGLEFTQHGQGWVNTHSALDEAEKPVPPFSCDLARSRRLHRASCRVGLYSDQLGGFYSTLFLIDSWEFASN